jgi:hypothetical protein
MKARSIFFAAALALVGCAKTGDVQEKTPVADLAAYSTAAVAVEVPSSVKDSQKHQSTLTNALAERLKQKRFDVVGADAAALLVKVKVTDVDEGSQLARGLSAGGESNVKVTVELVDVKSSKSVGSFDATGNSKKDSQMKINGLNTDAVADTTGRALEAAADQIADFLEAHRKK